jgi:imidazolonepropionase-like amidohydrolase
MNRTPSCSHVLYLCLFVVLGGCSTPGSPETQDGWVVLRGGLLIDGNGSEPVEDVAIVIQGDRIAWVGPSRGLTLEVEAKVIDLDGAAILPGFINTHVHHGFNRDNLREWAAGGVTTVRDLGTRLESDLFSVRDKLNEDDTLARLVAAGPMVTVPDGYPTVPWGSVSGYPVASVEGAREGAEAILDAGADLIKIALERGDVFGREIPVLTEGMVSENVTVAHGRGTVVSAHITAARDVELALRAGIDDIAHMAATSLSDDLINEVIAEGIYWVPTLELWHNIGHGFPSVAQDNLRRFVSKGGEVALGTDFGGYSTPFELGMPSKEIDLMEQAGMTPMQVILAATRNAARVCNLGSELGTIEVGKIADILVLEGNPLEELRGALQQVRLVVHNGTVIRNEIEGGGE